MTRPVTTDFRQNRTLEHHVNWFDELRRKSAATAVKHVVFYKPAERMTSVNELGDLITNARHKP